MAHSQDPTYPLFPIFSLLGFFLCLVPLPWHLQAWNAGTCAYMIWTSLACLIEFVNSIVWSGNLDNVAPVWCDISSKLLLGAGIGIPAATLCISRRLYSIASIQTVSVTRQDKKRAIIFDLCIAVGIPVLIMALHYVVQPHRFDILEDIGCYAAIYNTLPAYFLFFMWPVVLGCISFIYSSLTLRCFWKRRAQFSEVMASNPSLNTSRYLRLMLLAIFDMLLTIPLGIYSIYISNKGVTLAPWISWKNVHLDFSRVDLVPTIVWRSDPSFETSVELTRWIYILSAFVFFGLFGFANEAKKHYSLVFWRIAKLFGFKPPTKKSVHSFPASKIWNKPSNAQTIASQESLPVYPRSPMNQKNGSESLTTSLAGSQADLELHPYPSLDIEKSAGLLPSPSSSAPPEYGPRSEDTNSVYSSHCHSQSQPHVITDDITLSSESRDRIYISGPHPSTARARSPSPPPFTRTIIPAFHWPFERRGGDSDPHSDAIPDAIQVVVHTQSTDAV